jgi:hypothetical protein
MSTESENLITIEKVLEFINSEEYNEVKTQFLKEEEEYNSSSTVVASKLLPSNSTPPSKPVSFRRLLFEGLGGTLFTDFIESFKVAKR